MIARLRREDGFSIPELLIALVIAMIVSLATFALIDTTMSRSAETTGRVDAVQRGRGAMDTISRQLRSQVCVWRSDSPYTEARAVDSATATAVAFFTDLQDESYRAGGPTAPKPPELHTVSYESGKLVERSWAGVAGATLPQKYSFPGTPKVRSVLYDVVPLKNPDGTSIPILRYFAYNTATPPRPDLELNPGAGTLSAAQAQSVARIQIKYRVLPSNAKSTGRNSSVFQTDVYVRSADPNAAKPKPTCA